MNTFKTPAPFRTLCAALALAGLSSAASATGSLVFSPTVTNTTVGSAVSVQVRGDSFTDMVVGGGFNMRFDAAILSLDAVLVNNAVWDFLVSPGTIDNSAGTLSNTFFNAFTNLPTGNFAVATLNFTAKALGTSTLELSTSPSFPFANDAVQTIDVNFGTGSIHVTAVPEPSTWATLALGLALLPMLRRRLAATRAR